MVPFCHMYRDLNDIYIIYRSLRCNIESQMLEKGVIIYLAINQILYAETFILKVSVFKIPISENDIYFMFFDFQNLYIIIYFRRTSFLYDRYIYIMN